MASMDWPITRKPTRSIQVGSVRLGDSHPIVVQSMCATKTTDVRATVLQIGHLMAAGAGIVRLAADTSDEARAVVEIRNLTTANLSVDLQENYRLAAELAPVVDKIRYNPGHLYHHEPKRSWQDKVRYLVDRAGAYGRAIRVGVNCGSIDPALRGKYPPDDWLNPMLESALDHCELLDKLRFGNYCVSLKDSDPVKVVEVNRRFAVERPDVPLHLGVTEAGMPPEGIAKTRAAIEALLADGIGDTIRVSLTVPVNRKVEEVVAGHQILADVAAGRFFGGLEPRRGLNIISCPSCSRVENSRFIELAEQVRELTRYAADRPVTIAVMGCRVNGPGETDHADLGLWCGPTTVNLKRGPKHLGAYSYEEILPRLKQELDAILADLAAGQPRRTARAK